MSRLQIPYKSVLIEPRDFDPAETDDICRLCLEKSMHSPIALEISSHDIQYMAFANEGQLAWASAIDAGKAKSLRLRDFFSNLRRIQFPQVVAYHMDLALMHSLLVFLQKKPDLTVASTLVDLEELLARVENEKSNAIISARDPDILILLRIQNGAPVACYRPFAISEIKERNAKENFLVSVYTISVKHPLEINLFTDLCVANAEDARSIPADFEGSISAFYLTRPPRLVVRLKGRPLKAYQLDGSEITIGRLPDNAIVIDNLSVSRRHAAISQENGSYKVRDLASKNGTLLNGSPITSASLADGDVITIGKYDILFQVPSADAAIAMELDQTILVQRDKLQVPCEPSSPAAREKKNFACLFRKSTMDNLALEKEKTTIGRSREADIRLKGLFSPRAEAEVIRKKTGFLLRVKRGTVKINGEKTKEKLLESEDLIAIGSEQFVFKG